MKDSWLEKHANWVVPTIVMLALALGGAIAQSLRDIKKETMDIRHDMSDVRDRIAKIEGKLDEKDKRTEVAKCVPGL